MNEENQKIINIDDELKQIEDQKSEFRKKQGYADPVNGAMMKGTNDVRVDLKQTIRETTNAISGKDQAVFRATINGQTGDWFLNKQNPIYHQILKKLKNEENTFVILQSGDGKLTRYEILDKDQKKLEKKA